MALTKEQERNLFNLDPETQLEIMHVCADALGLVDIPTYEKVMLEKRRTIYDKMNREEIKPFLIGKHKFPLINYYL
jgi:hypothetical protein